MSIFRFNHLLFPVMILDDDSDILHTLAGDLKGIALIECFNDPASALRALTEKKYAVIVSDLNMPQMSGIDFLEKARMIQPDAQRIMVTAFADLADPEQSINRAQINHLLTKPWEKPNLREVVGRAYKNYQLIKENETLRTMALTDELTKVANHRYFWENLDSEFSRARRFKRNLSLVIADIDNFKSYNDTHGHLEGDRILHDVAQCLERGRRSMDLVARYGGEEFGIILPEVSGPEAVTIAKRHLENCDTETGISISFGVANFPNDAQSPTELVYYADQALLQAKKEGKHRVVGAQQKG